MAASARTDKKVWDLSLSLSLHAFVDMFFSSLGCFGQRVHMIDFFNPVMEVFVLKMVL